MTAPNRHSDLIEQMFVCVYEETPLSELTWPVTDQLGPGPPVVHGPWSAAECRHVLATWLELGWIELYAFRRDESPAPWRERAAEQGEHLVLDRNDARNLLNDPARWELDGPDGMVMLARSDEGSRHEYADWVAVVGDVGN